MFPRSRRLSRTDFSRSSVSRGERRSSSHFSVVIPHEGQGYAVVISKKTVKLSVKRHLLKRRILSALRKLDLPPSLIVYPKAGSLTLPFKELTEQLKTTIGRKTLSR